MTSFYCEHESALGVREKGRWRVVSPVNIDEAVLALESMLLARERGQERFPF